MQGKMSEIGLMMMQCERAMRARAIRNVRLNSAGGTKQFVMFVSRASNEGQSFGMSRWHRGGDQRGRRDMPTLLGDLLLFSCLAVWVVGTVIAIANLVS